jgi:hypothetical protein
MCEEKAFEDVSLNVQHIKSDKNLQIYPSSQLFASATTVNKIFYFVIFVKGADPDGIGIEKASAFVQTDQKNPQN